MKTLLETLLRESLDALPESMLPRAARDVRIEVARSRNASHGDFASNIAMRLARRARREPLALAEALARGLPRDPALARVEVAGAGHINFFLRKSSYHAELIRALSEGVGYGSGSSGAGRRIGLALAGAHACARRAAYANSLVRLLQAGGVAVTHDLDCRLDALRQRIAIERECLVYVCGPDTARRAATLRACYGAEQLEVRVVQPVLGPAEALHEDTVRFLGLLRSHELPLELDHELARRRSTDNPLFCVQYAHARLAGLKRELAQRGFAVEAGRGSLARLTLPAESGLLKRIGAFPDAVQKAAQNRAPHLLANELLALAHEVHAYQAAHAIVVSDEALRNARLCLGFAAQIVIANGLGLLGVAAPDGV